MPCSCGCGTKLQCSMHSTVPSGEEIYATLYAQRMFFRVTSQPQGTSFEAMPFSDARHHAEQNLLRLRRNQ